MTAEKKKYYYLFTSILFFNILAILFDAFFSQKLWDKILFKTVKHHSFFDSALFEFFYFNLFELCLVGIFFSLLFLIVTSQLPDSEQSEQLAEDKTMAKNFILSGIVEKKRHSFQVSVSDSLYKAIKYHAVERNFTTDGAAEDMLEKSVLKLPIIYDLYADEKTNTINNIKYYLEEIKKNVKDSVLMVHDESYGHVAEDFISFLEPLSSNPMTCFNSGNLARIEKEFMNILLVAYDAGLRAGISVFPLEESYFYSFLNLCKKEVEKERR